MSEGALFHIGSWFSCSLFLLAFSLDLFSSCFALLYASFSFPNSPFSLSLLCTLLQTPHNGSKARPQARHHSGWSVFHFFLCQKAAAIAPILNAEIPSVWRRHQKVRSRESCCSRVSSYVELMRVCKYAREREVALATTKKYV